jgi:hypothetical protein
MIVSAVRDPAEERTAIDNAIWVCQNCAKMIDSDIKRFSVQILHQWKRKFSHRVPSAIH